MKLDLTPDQQMLRETVARMLQVESSPGRVRAAETTGFDAALWRQLVATGIVAMRVPESAGGGGMGLFEAALVLEEAGRHLASAPLAEAISAAHLLAVLPGDAAAELLAAALRGRPTLLVPQPVAAGETQALPVAMEGVLIALQGEEVFACAQTGGAPAPNLGAGPWVLGVLPEPGVEGSRRRIASGPQARTAFLAAIEEWKLLQAAALAGLARRAVEMAAAYAAERTQFGKLIGSFQGIAHPLADALTEIDGARLLVWRAIWALARHEGQAASFVSMAWWWATQSAARAVACALHTFGGYGVSLEYDIQLYYRRAKAWALLAGDPQRELAVLADRLWPTSDWVPPLPQAGEVTVEFGYGAAAEAFAQEVRAFFDAHLTDELRALAHHSVAGYAPAFHRQLAQAGLLFPHWPAAYGGRGKTAFDMAALAEVFETHHWQRVTGPVTNQVAQTVMQFGSAAVKDEVLPNFAQGEAVACLGFTEPASGSDVFAAKTRAERQGDDWVINGQKIFTTAADVADYIFLLVRTAPELPKHAGLTLFLVPMNLPGIEIQAVHTIQDERTNITYLSEVRVPDRYRVGEVNAGVSVMAATLELEHGGDQYRISFSHMLQHAVRWAQGTQRAGRPLIEQPDVRQRLARVAVHTTVALDLCYRSIWATSHKVPGRAAFGPMSKLFSTEHYQTDAADLMDLAAPHSLFGGPGDVGQLELAYRQSIGMTIYGGTSEVHRSLIAEQALGMPRSRV